MIKAVLLVYIIFPVFKFQKITLSLVTFRKERKKKRKSRCSYFNHECRGSRGFVVFAKWDIINAVMIENPGTANSQHHCAGG